MTITQNPDGLFYVVCTPLEGILLRVWVLEHKVSSIKPEKGEDCEGYKPITKEQQP